MSLKSYGSLKNVNIYYEKNNSGICCYIGDSSFVLLFENAIPFFLKNIKSFKIFSYLEYSFCANGKFDL